MTSQSVTVQLPFNVVGANDPRALAAEIKALQISDPSLVLSPLANVVSLPSSPYYVTQGDAGNLFYVSTTGAAVTIYLPSSTGVEVGSKFSFVRQDVFNNLTLSCQGSDVLCGSVATSSVAPVQKVSILSAAPSTGANVDVVCVAAGKYQIMGVACQFA